MYHAYVQDLRSTAAYAAVVGGGVMPLLRRLDAEDAHALGIAAAAAGLAPRDARVAEREAALASTVCGLRFRNPVGLAAGFDKQANAMPGLLDAGFGFIEVGFVALLCRGQADAVLLTSHSRSPVPLPQHRHAATAAR